MVRCCNILLGKPQSLMPPLYMPQSLMPLLYHHIWSSYMMIIYMMIMYDDHIWWSCMMIIYDDHIWWSYMMIMYDDHTLWWYMMIRMIIYDDHIWWSCMMIIYDAHVWWSYMMKMLVNNLTSMLKVDFVSEIFGDLFRTVELLPSVFKLQLPNRTRGSFILQKSK